MGNVAGWLAGCLFAEEQTVWHAASTGDHRGLRAAIGQLTPDTRRHLEWRDPCSGRTPLAQAAAKGHVECARALVEAGVNVNAKDFKGNTPLHLAGRFGHSAVVQLLVHVVTVVPFEVNTRLQTPLDVARDRLRRRQEDGQSRNSTSSVAYEECITELEKKFYIYSGWLYEKTDNLLSAVSGIPNLSSWKHRYCLVLQRGLPDVLELALFSLRKGEPRPVLPKSVILFHVQTGIVETTDGKWFNRKSFAFTVKGSVLLRDGCCEERGRQAATTRTVEFAAIDADSFEMWKSFFLHQQEMLAVAQGRAPQYQAPANHAPVVAAGATPGCLNAPLPTYYTPSASAGVNYSVYPADMGREPHARSASSSQTSVATTMSVLRDEDQEDEELRRAIELSLLDAQHDRHARPSAPPASSRGSLYPPLPITSSAPVWTDGEAEGAFAGSYTGRSVASSPSESADGGGERSRHHEHADREPVVSFSRAPITTSIGECVVCFDGPQAAVCVPCGHNAVCMPCAEEILETTCECPVCRHPIRELIKLYRV